MINIGSINNLTVIKQVDFGFYLDGDNLDDILLPQRYAPDDLEEGDKIEVFIYLDSEDRVIATTEIPKCSIGEPAFLKVVDINHIGAFLDWGLSKDLLVPFQEQRNRMQKDHSYLVYVYLDNSGRIAASSKLDNFLEETNRNDQFEEKQEVNLQLASRSQLGYKAVINNSHLGLIHHDDIFGKVKLGEKSTGYIKKIRPDGKIDLSLQKSGLEGVELLAQDIMDYLEENNGFVNLTDKSPAEDIAAIFKTSKSNFKKALGRLYKKELIEFGKYQIRLNSENSKV